MDYRIVKLRERPELVEKAVRWFPHTFGVPEDAYRESMEEMLESGGAARPRDKSAAVPQWYAALVGEEIVGGLGVIENDFHDRRDLAPNVCAVYVEEPYRGQGIAREMLQTVCGDMAALGIDTLYLVTSHTSLYERYGWEFFCMANGGDGPVRVYVHRQP